MMPELPNEKKIRFMEFYKLSEYDSSLLAADKDLADFFEEVTKESNSPKLSTNWIMGEFLAELNKENLNIIESKVSAKQLGVLIRRIEDSTISGKIAKEVFEKMWASSKDTDDIIREQGLQQVTDLSEIEKMVEEVIKKNPDQLKKYLSGKDRLFGFFVGQVMKESKGKANPAQVNQILKGKLKK
jgi:aspartyl-tRNA(Asn)/glutamyl-tRNA(Gln) amidotransferase subunit B